MAALICTTLVRHVELAWSFAVRVGVVTGLVTAVGITVSPFVEYYADGYDGTTFPSGAWEFCIWLLLRLRASITSILAGDP